MSSEVGFEVQAGPPTVDRVRLDVLRYAVNGEASHYVAIMRLFTSGERGADPVRSTAVVDVGVGL